VWIDADDFAVVRIEGHPPRISLSGSNGQTLCANTKKSINFWLWKKRHDLC
jgi:hypothetical protein